MRADHACTLYCLCQNDDVGREISLVLPSRLFVFCALGRGPIPVPAVSAAGRGHRAPAAPRAPRAPPPHTARGASANI
jgi:hypothetical protein